MLERESHSRNIGIIIIVYALCHGLLLFNQGLFWDDWTLLDTQPGVIIETFRFIGLPWLGYVHIFLLNTIGIIGYRFITFGAYLLAGLCFYGIMVRTARSNYDECLLIALLFVTFPVNSARIALINVMYSVCYSLFFVAWWLTVCYCERPRGWLRIVIFVLFLFSFFTSSLLVFYGLVLLYIWYRERTIEKLLAHYAEWFVNPILYWVVKSIWFKPYGPWEQYNHLTVASLASGFDPHNLSIALINSFIHPLAESLLLSPISIGICTMLTFAVMVWWYRCRRHDELMQSEPNPHQLTILFMIGCLAFLLAHYPYFAVGREDTIPSVNDWFSRHQLLVPLGASLMVYVLLSHTHRWFRRGLAVWLLMMFVVMNLTVYTEYQRDFLKQQSLITVFRQNPVLSQHHTFYVNDQLWAYNARNRGYRTLYEYQGLLKHAFHSEDRIAMDYTFVRTRFLLAKDDPDRTLFFHFKYMFNLAHYQDVPIEYTMTLQSGQLTLSPKNVWWLTGEYLMDRENFERNIAQVVQIDFKPFTVEDIPKQSL